MIGAGAGTVAQTIWFSTAMGAASTTTSAEIGGAILSGLVAVALSIGDGVTQDCAEHCSVVDTLYSHGDGFGCMHLLLHLFM
jgi:hypothetical protein